MTSNIRTYSKNKQLVVSRRAKIARSAASLFLKRGYHNITVRELAEACNMGLGTLYYYIGSKENILQLVLEYSVGKFAEFYKDYVDRLANMSATDALSAAIDAYYRMIDEQQDFLLFSYRELSNLQGEARKLIIGTDIRIVESFEKLLNTGCASGEFNIDDTKILAHNIVTLGEVWAVRRWYLKKFYTLDEYIRKETKSILNEIVIKKCNSNSS